MMRDEERRGGEGKMRGDKQVRGGEDLPWFRVQCSITLLSISPHPPAVSTPCTRDKVIKRWKGAKDDE